MRPWVAFVLGLATYYAYEHFFSSPHLPVGKYGRG